MCSLSGDLMFTENSVNKKHNLSTCKKCRTSNPVVVLRKTDAYCKNCFLEASTHKFRATLGKHRVIKPNDKVLVLYRPGHASAALLHFIRTGLDLPQHKKLRFSPIFLFIDGNQKYKSEKEHEDLLREVYEHVTFYGFDVLFISLCEYLTNNREYKAPKYYKYEDYLTTVRSKNVIYCDTIPRNSGEATLHQNGKEVFVRKLTIEVARQLSCPVVLTPETVGESAAAVLSAVALGRGQHIPMMAGASVIDRREVDVTIFAPLRQFEIKELALYNHHSSTRVVAFDAPSQVMPDTVQQLMHQFVFGLQDNYPATVHTVTRTADKLSCKANNTNVCQICRAPLEIHSTDGPCSPAATVVSRYLSTSIPILDMAHWKSTTDIDNSFCFACSRTAQTVPTLTTLGV